MANEATPAHWADLRAKEAALLATAPVPVTAHDIEVAGTSIHYLEAGDPKLPPLVMVHGRGSAAVLWLPIIPPLAPHRRIIAVDMRGWGLSSRAPFTGHSGAEAVGWWRDGVLGVVDALGVTRFDLIGHSLGGMVALAIALERGEVIDHLILEDSAGLGTTSPLGIRLYFAAEPERMAHFVPRALFDRIAGGSVPIPGLSAAARKALSDFVYTLTLFPGTQASGVRAFNAILGLGGVKYTLRDQVQRIQILTRVLWGTKDGVVPLSTAQAGIRSMPNAGLVTFAGAGHSPHMEVPNLFAASVLEFLARGTETPVTAPPPTPQPPPHP
jgi:pimeloyl-ACP methyl ester carboxylesterase